MNRLDTGEKKPRELKKAVILAVDDDPSIRELLKMCFDMPQYNLLVAQDGNEALTIYRQQFAAIDLVLLDIMLPQMDGIQLFRVMRQVNSQIKCLFVSGSLGSLDVEMLRAEGVLGFIEKPFQIEVLMNRVANTLMLDAIRNELDALEQ